MNHNSAALAGLDATRDWYASNCPDRYAMLRSIYKACQRVDPQWPEAGCVDASFLVSALLPDMVIVCGRMRQQPAGTTSIGHNWNYDISAGVFVDITASQFGGIFAGRKVVVVRPPAMRQLGYQFVMDEQSFGSIEPSQVVWDAVQTDPLLQRLWDRRGNTEEMIYRHFVVHRNS
jgi:hypothetical protein